MWVGIHRLRIKMSTRCLRRVWLVISFGGWSIFFFRYRSRSTVSCSSASLASCSSGSAPTDQEPRAEQLDSAHCSGKTDVSREKTCRHTRTHVHFPCLYLQLVVLFFCWLSSQDLFGCASVCCRRPCSACLVPQTANTHTHNHTYWHTGTHTHTYTHRYRYRFPQWKTMLISVLKVNILTIMIEPINRQNGF